MRKIRHWKKTVLYTGLVVAIISLTGRFSTASEKLPEKPSASVYEKWEVVGRLAAKTSLNLMKKSGVSAQKGNMVSMTNAGYAEVNGSPTQGALDGLASVTGAKRGRNTLVEVHSTPFTSLWFAVYDMKSGLGTYLEVDSPKAVEIKTPLKKQSAGMFRITAVERINADYIYQHVAEYQIKFNNKVFGGNEFRIIGIANAVANGAPTYAVRAFEFHDHYCPGVTSGILMAEYVKKHFSPGNSGYFVHTVDPWCKDDALMVLLNATPGKRCYAVSYPTDADRAARIPEAKDAATIVYRQNEQSKRWEGMILGFRWAETSCPKTGSDLIDKLCADLWYLKQMEKPEGLVKVVKTFELPEGVSPADWAGPGLDPLRMLGLSKK